MLKRIFILTTFITSLFSQDITNKLGGDTANETYDITDSNDKLLFQVTGQGRVGIGTTSYDETLHVNGGSIFWGLMDVRNSGGTTLFKVWENGKVGINSTGPDELFDVNGNMRLYGDFVLDGGIKDSNSDLGTAGQILSSTGTATDWIDVPSGSSDWTLTGNSGTTTGTNFVGTTDNQALEFKVNNQLVMRYEPNVNVPNILGGHYDNSISAGVWGAFIGGGGYIANANEVTANWASVLGGLNNTANGVASTAMGGGATANGKQSTAMGLGTIANGENSTSMGKYTEANGENSVAMGIYNIGSINSIFEIGIGTGSTDKKNAFTVQDNGDVGINTDNPTAELHIKDNGNNGRADVIIDSGAGYDAQLNLYENGIKKWQIETDGGSGILFITDAEGNDGVSLNQNGSSWNAYSDLRLKENIVPIENVLESIIQIQPVKYNMIGSTPRQIGLIAQEIQPHFPEIVSGKEKDSEYLALSYDRLGPILLQAIKELTMIVEKQGKRIAKLENQLNK